MSTSTSRFDIAMSLILPLEGGLVNNPNDPGGLTNRGITLATYKAYLGQKSVNRSADIPHAASLLRNLSISEAKAIYALMYAQSSAAGACSLPLYILVLDMAINSGTTTARKYLQRAINATLPADHEKLKIDGQIGPKTKLFLSLINHYDAAIELAALRRQFYENIISRNPRLAVFRKGWNNRIDTLLKYIKTHTKREDYPIGSTPH